jgi:hypothetical protein
MVSSAAVFVGLVEHVAELLSGGAHTCRQPVDQVDLGLAALESRLHLPALLG